MQQADKPNLYCQVCLARRGAQKLLCLSCWRRVPAPLQRDVNRTWRAFNAAVGKARLPALALYRVARDAAIEAVRAQTTTPTVTGEDDAHQAR
ncbi:MAG: hypothetical protein Q8K45_21245 [Rubrivivax sp.]|nr:hypothetical protein [Rubrivivax sp.]